MEVKRDKHNEEGGSIEILLVFINHNKDVNLNWNCSDCKELSKIVDYMSDNKRIRVLWKPALLAYKIKEDLIREVGCIIYLNFTKRGKQDRFYEKGSGKINGGLVKVSIFYINSWHYEIIDGDAIS